MIYVNWLKELMPIWVLLGLVVTIVLVEVIVGIRKKGKNNGE